MIKSKFKTCLNSEDRISFNKLKDKNEKLLNIIIFDNDEYLLKIINIQNVKSINNNKFKEIIKLEFVLRNKSLKTEQNFNRFVVVKI